MSSKLLFVFGIVAAHGAVAAAWVQQDAPQARSPIATCVKAPETSFPDFTPRAELLAQVMPVEFATEVLQP